jgi:LysM repeat protein
MGCATIIKIKIGVEEMHMASIKRGALVASTLILIAIIISACNQPYSQQPSVTNTPIDQSLFATPLNQTPSMSDVEVFGTGTALALTGTPVGGVATQTPLAPVDLTSQALAGTATPTPLVFVTPLFTSTATLAVSGTNSGSDTGGTVPTSAPYTGTRPATYTLQKGEFPFCIARRFDVDPAALLSLNGLSSGDIYYPNLTLKIPQSGSFPGTRALRNHPATYTVSGSDQTVSGVACLFGDVDPAAIAQANNISVSAALTSGQQLSIP